MSLLSSSLITLYMTGMAAITISSTITMLAWSLNIQSESRIATLEYANPMKNISHGLFSALSGLSSPSRTMRISS